MNWRIRRRLRQAIIWGAAAAMVLAVGPAALAGTGNAKKATLDVTAPARTDRASVQLTGHTVAGATVMVTGSAVPQTVFADTDGAFSVEVALHPEQRNVLRVVAASGSQRESREVRVLQHTADPGEQLTGRVLDLDSRSPLAGAVVSYGKRYAVTDAQGRYTLSRLPAGLVVPVARARGHLDGVTLTPAGTGTGQASDMLLQALAAPVPVGPAAATFTGTGWRVDVPAGAVPVPSQLTLTSLETSTGLDLVATPVLALSAPHLVGQLTVTLDPAAVGLDPAATEVVRMDDDGAVTTPPVQLVDHHLVVHIGHLHGTQLRLRATPGSQRRTVWETILGQIHNGVVDLNTALQAFSLAATPLPGVRVPAGPVGDMPSASGPIRWLLGHEAELDAAQRHVLDAWQARETTGPSDPVPLPAAATRSASRAAPQAAAIPAECAPPAIQKAVALIPCAQQGAALIAQHLGRSLGMNVRVRDGFGQSMFNPLGELGDAVGLSAGGTEMAGKGVTCLITFTPGLWIDAAENPSAIPEAVFHEMFHCFQYAFFPNMSTVKLAPPWVLEGQPEWAAFDLTQTGFIGRTFWKDYLTEPGTALYDRAYDAVGFYSHLAESGVDPWTRFDAALNAVAAGADNDGLFRATVTDANLDAFLDSWPSGYARGRRPGAAWDTTGPGITSDAPSISTVDITNDSSTTVDAPKVGNGIQELNLSADLTTFDSGGRIVHGRLGPSSGDDIPAGSLMITWCTKDGGCVCPDGTPSAGASFPDLAPGDAWLAVTAGLDQDAAVTVTGSSLTDECNQPPPNDGGLPPGGTTPPGGNQGDGGTGPDTGPQDPGSGGSYGDPHFITYDHGALSFLGAGDYVLAESTVDDFLVQGRYQRLRLPDGTASSGSYNRGIAARVGSSVIAFGDDLTSRRHDPPVATLDGQRIALTDGMRTNLPGGAVLTFTTARGAVVRWPDGTEMDAGRWVGDNAFLTLAPSRWGKVRGLLGNADRDPTNDITARDGTVVHNVLDAHQMYDVFGASWRAQGADSLFRTVLPDDDVVPVDPPGTTTLAALPADARQQAEQTCRAKGLLPNAGLEQCIFDVAVSGDATFADDEAVVANLLRRTVDLAALGAPVENTTQIQLGQRVTGSLDTSLQSDVYQIDLQAGGNITITTPGSCPHPGTFVITLLAPSGQPVARTSGDGCGKVGVTGLRESGQYRLVVFDTGGFTGGYELQVDGAQLDLSCQANEVAPNDDASSPQVNLPFTVNFFGQRFSSLWVNNNGNVTFDGPLSTFTPEPLATISSPIVAAWFADVDTRGTGSQPVRFGFGSVGGHRAFCVQYDGVGYFNAHDDLLNSFDLFIVDRGDVADGAFDIVFRYGQLRWETGDASGGVNGLGGTSAGVGYSNGTGQPGTFLEVAGSRQPGSFLDTGPHPLSSTSTNSSEAGVHIFPVRAQ
jgi:hypothetical protein